MNKKYNYFSNLGFMLREHWIFDKSYVLMQMVLTPLGALTSVVAAYLPKVVLANYVCAYNEFSSISISDGFISGFRLGARFTYDTFIEAKKG